MVICLLAPRRDSKSTFSAFALKQVSIFNKYDNKYGFYRFTYLYTLSRLERDKYMTLSLWTANQSLNFCWIRLL